MTAVKEIRTVTLGNGNEVTYKITDSGTAYHQETPDEVVSILEGARDYGRRVRLYYGDTKTGQDWNEEFDTMGTVGRSTGNIKIPLLISNARSMGGGAILDHCIVKIATQQNDGKYHVVYTHPNYYTRPFIINDNGEEWAKNHDGNRYSVSAGAELVAIFKDRNKAQRYVDFMLGKRNRK